MPKGDFLGEFETLVLLALLRLGDDAYGLAVGREIAERAGREVTIGAVYATLDRMESKGLVRSTVREPTADRGGRAKRCYTVTAAGTRALRHSQEALGRMLDGLAPGFRPV